MDFSYDPGLPRDILIIGAGAIGCLVAGGLAQAGQVVTLVGRPRTAEAIARQGLRVSQDGRTATVGQVRAVSSIRAAFEGRPRYRLAVLTVKSYDTAQAVAELAAATADPPPVLTLQNGVGNEETLAAQLGQAQVIAGVITTPASVPEPGHVLVERNLKQIGVASLVDPPPTGVPSAAQVADLFAAAGFEARTYPDWRSLKWTKLVMNLLCNASCALLGWSPAQVWADRPMAELEMVAWREALAVVRRLGCRLVDLGGYPLRLLDPWLRSLPTGLLYRPLGHFVVGGRGGKMPSLYLDLERGKRSEVGWLNGAVVTAGQALGMPVPANGTLAGSLSAVVEGEEAWETYRGRPEALLARWRAARDPVTVQRPG
jgi:2-dehydropantoate 2-reductase